MSSVSFSIEENSFSLANIWESRSLIDDEVFVLSMRIQAIVKPIISDDCLEYIKVVKDCPEHDVRSIAPEERCKKGIKEVEKHMAREKDPKEREFQQKILSELEKGNWKPFVKACTPIGDFLGAKVKEKIQDLQGAQTKTLLKLAKQKFPPTIEPQPRRGKLYISQDPRILCSYELLDFTVHLTFCNRVNKAVWVESSSIPFDALFGEQDTTKILSDEETF